LVTAAKPRAPRAVLWVGRLAEGITETALTEFVTRRADEVGLSAFKVHNARVFHPSPKAKTNLFGARITVDECHESSLLQPTFWPRPIYSRRWEFPDPKQRSSMTADTADLQPAQAEAAAAM